MGPWRRIKRCAGKWIGYWGKRGRRPGGWPISPALVPAKLGDFPRAVSLALAMEPQVMASIRQGPNQTYTELYEATNQRLNRICGCLRDLLTGEGRRAWAVPASVRSDPVNIRGDFPHKTAATRAGLGWVGKNCQLINRRLGPWLRLGTVFTDAAADPGPAGGKELLRNLHRVRGGLPGRGPQGRNLAARPGTGGYLGPGGVRCLQKDPLQKFPTTATSAAYAARLAPGGRRLCAASPASLARLRQPPAYGVTGFAPAST